MYQLSEYEFYQYEIAENRLKALREKHDEELQEAYEGINPTMTCYDYGLCNIYVGSVDPAEYAVYLVELQEKHKQIEEWWSKRAKAYKQAFYRLTESDRACLINNEYGKYQERQNALQRLRVLLNDVVANRPELQRVAVSTEAFDEIEKVDEEIENMSDKELFDGYINIDEQILAERKIKRGWRNEQKQFRNTAAY